MNEPELVEFLGDDETAPSSPTRRGGGLRQARPPAAALHAVAVAGAALAIVSTFLPALGTQLSLGPTVEVDIDGFGRMHLVRSTPHSDFAGGTAPPYGVVAMVAAAVLIAFVVATWVSARRVWPALAVAGAGALAGCAGCWAAEASTLSAHGTSVAFLSGWWLLIVGAGVALGGTVAALSRPERVVWN